MPNDKFTVTGQEHGVFQLAGGQYGEGVRVTFQILDTGETASVVIPQPAYIRQDGPSQVAKAIVEYIRAHETVRGL